MSGISRLILNTILYEVNNSNTSRTISNPESFSKLLKSSINTSLGYSNSSSYNKSDISSLEMIMTLTGILNQSKTYNRSLNECINNNQNSINNAMENNKQNLNVINTISENNIECINSNMQKAINLLKEQLGKPYVWGNEGPDSFDCSGLVQYIYKNALGKNIPRVSADQSKFGQAISRDNLQPGDLVFFDTMNKGKVSHVGMYIGNNEFIHAANSKKGVIKSTLTGYYDKKFINARRP